MEISEQLLVRTRLLGQRMSSLRTEMPSTHCSCMPYNSYSHTKIHLLHAMNPNNLYLSSLPARVFQPTRPVKPLTHTHKYLYPEPRYRFFAGTGMGSPGIPQGYPCRTLDVACCCCFVLSTIAGSVCLATLCH